MKTINTKLVLLTLASSLILQPSSFLEAATTIDPANRYAYAANLGWIHFENTGAPAVDLVTGNLSGYAYSANCGWISLSNATAHVRTVTILAGADTDGDGLPDAWEWERFGNLTGTGTGDADGDGKSNLAEYLAGTDPNNAADNLRITSFQRGLLATPTRLDMQWTSQPTRQYAIQSSSDLTTWADFAVLPGLGANIANWLEAADQRFYRVRAFRPLTP